MLQKKGIQPNVVMSGNTLDSQKQFVLEGLGVALLPIFTVDQEISQKKLFILHGRAPYHYSVKLVTKKQRTLSRNAARFLETLRPELVKWSRS
ncbi:MAG: LysR family transcriptional regulator substrate-binding protein [Deltaproteobacteria bacterium]|nr:LysR family transcriptional regulator substrate-binding protein [Deltaproteobacteria bacterium]